MDGVDLDDLELHIALRATQDLALFHFVFIDVNLGVAIRASYQGRVSFSRDVAPAGVLYTARVKDFLFAAGRVIAALEPMANREYPDRPVVGVGGVVIQNGRALLIRRAGEPLAGKWSIPGGTLELGETIAEGVRRELREETGLIVRVGPLIEVFERIFAGQSARPQYHFVIVDYLCEAIGGSPQAGGDASELALVADTDLGRYSLSAAATRVIKKAFAMSRAAT